MDIINKILTLANKYSARFISVRFIDLIGKLQQIDVIVTNLNIIQNFIIIGNKKFKVIEDKYFFDPFRSHPTIFCLCEDLSSGSNPRIDAKHFMDNTNIVNQISFECKIDFSVNSQDKESVLSDGNDSFEQLDKLANLRSEIIDTIENTGIKTTYHRRGSRISQCIIGIKGENFLDMADNILITKYIISNVAESYGKNVAFTRDNAIPLSLYLNFSNYNKNIAKSFTSSVQQNLNKILSFMNRVVDNPIKVEFNEDFNIVKVLIEIIEINPYISLTALMLYGTDNND